MPDQPNRGDASRPWLGLKAFGPITQHLFFGRSREIRELFQRVKDQQLTVLYGKSGLGKTSLLGAGLVPRLLIEGFRPALIRLRFGANDPPLRDQVHNALSTTLGKMDGATNGKTSEHDTPTLWERIHHIPSRAPDLTTALPVLIFDQFEEVFTLADADQVSSGRRGQVATLLEELADLVENRPPPTVRARLLEDRELAEDYDFESSPLRIVIALREDYLASLESSSNIMPSLMRNRQMLRELDGNSALEAVVAPGRRDDVEIISDDVGRSIVCFVARRAFGTPLEEIVAVPPILSLMCFELNEARLASGAPSITAEQVEGESEEILHSFYERTFAGLAPPVRHLVEDRLLTRSGHRNSIAREDALAELESAGVRDGVAAIDRLIAGRILTSEEVGGIQRLELTHDVLAPLAMRSRNERQERERAERAERDREESQRRALAAQRERNRMRKIVVAMTGLVIVALGSTVLSWRKTREAQVAAARMTFLEAERGLAAPETFWAGVRDLSRSFEMGLPSVDSRVGYRLAQVIERRPAKLGSVATEARLLDGPAASTWSASAPVAPPMTHKREVVIAAFSPDDRTVVTASEDGTARVWESITGRPLSQPMTHAARVNSVAFSPDGRSIVTASDDGTARVWDQETGRPLSEPVTHRGDVTHAAFSLDGRWIATASRDHTARVWNAKTGEPVGAPMKHQASVNYVGFSPDGRRIVTASADSTARIWDAETGASTLPAVAHRDAVVHAEFSSDARWVLTASADGTARVWDANTAQPVSAPLEHGRAVTFARFSPDGRWVVTTSDDGTAGVWEAATGKSVTRLLHDRAVRSAAFNSTGTQIVTASADNTARLWKTTTGELAAPKLEHADAVVHAAFSSDDRWVVTASLDRTARVWEAAAGTEVVAPIFHAGKVPVAVFTKDGQRVATASWDRTARVWESASGRPLTPPMHHLAHVTSIAFSPDGRAVVSASADNTARVWDAQTGRPLTAPLTHEEDVNHATFSPNGETVATASWDRTARVWDTTTAEPVTLPLEHQASVNDVGFSPDGRSVVTASGDGTARVWSAKTGEAVTPPIVHEDAVVHAEFSPDGRFALTASADGTARVWDARTGEPASSPLSHEEAVNFATFSPDGRWIVTASDDNTARVWDAATGEMILPSLVHDDNVIHAAFSSDGRWIATASWDHTARVWNAHTGRPRIAPVMHGDSVLHVGFSNDGRVLLTSSADGTARMIPLSSYEQADPARLADVLERIVACDENAAGDTGNCLAAAEFGAAVDTLTTAIESTDMRARFRYHLLGDPGAHPSLLGSAYSGKPDALRDALFPNTTLLGHWWRSTTYPELGAAWALALTQSEKREDRRTLAAVVDDLGHIELGPQQKQDRDLAALRLAALGTLQLGARDRRLLDADDFLDPWLAPPIRGTSASLHSTPGREEVALESLSFDEPYLSADASASELARAIDVLRTTPPTASEVAEVRPTLERQAESSPAAAYLLAKLISYAPDDRQEDRVRAHRLALLAANKGLVPAMHLVGTQFLGGKGIEVNIEAARSWLERAAAAGHHLSSYDLSRLYRDTDHDYAHAVVALRDAIQDKALEPHAVVELAGLIELGLGAPRDVAESRRLLQRGAEGGCSDAAFEYALRLDLGIGGPSDQAAARRWYEAAAMRGHGRAAYRLGQMLDQGIGVARDRAGAAHWYRLSAMSGHAAAHYALARVLLEDEPLRSDNATLARDALARLIDAYPQSTPDSDLAWLAGEAWILARSRALISSDATLPNRRDDGTGSL